MIRGPQERERAIQLRKQGKSIKEIASLLNVSSSTVSLWVRHIILSSKQKQRLVKKVFDTLQRGRKKALKVQKQSREYARKILLKEAIKEFGYLSKRDIFIAGLALYWAEGFKKDNRLGFANSDVAMIKSFLRWLEIAGVPKKDMRLRIGLNISHQARIKEVQQYWEKQTGISSEQFQKPFFQKFLWKKEFPNPETYFGVLRVRANNQGPLFIKIKAWIKALRENAAL